MQKNVDLLVRILAPYVDRLVEALFTADIDAEEATIEAISEFLCFRIELSVRRMVRGLNWKMRSGLWCTVKMRTPLTFELRFNIRGRRIILLCESTRLGDAVSFLRDYGFVPPFMLAGIKYEGEAYSPSKREILDAVAENEFRSC